MRNEFLNFLVVGNLEDVIIAIYSSLSIEGWVSLGASKLG